MVHGVGPMPKILLEYAKRGETNMMYFDGEEDAPVEGATEETPTNGDQPKPEGEGDAPAEGAQPSE